MTDSVQLATMPAKKKKAAMPQKDHDPLVQIDDAYVQVLHSNSPLAAYETWNPLLGHRNREVVAAPSQYMSTAGIKDSQLGGTK